MNTEDKILNFLKREKSKNHFSLLPKELKTNDTLNLLEKLLEKEFIEKLPPKIITEYTILSDNYFAITPKGEEYIYTNRPLYKLKKYFKLTKANLIRFVEIILAVTGIYALVFGNLPSIKSYFDKSSINDSKEQIEKYIEMKKPEFAYKYLNKIKNVDSLQDYFYYYSGFCSYLDSNNLSSSVELNTSKISQYSPFYEKGIQLRAASYSQISDKYLRSKKFKELANELEFKNQITDQYYFIRLKSLECCASISEIYTELQSFNNTFRTADFFGKFSIDTIGVYYGNKEVEGEEITFDIHSRAKLGAVLYLYYATILINKPKNTTEIEIQKFLKQKVQQQFNTKNKQNHCWVGLGNIGFQMPYDSLVSLTNRLIKE